MKRKGNGGGRIKGGMNVKINVNQLPMETCPRCGSPNYLEMYNLRKASPIQSPTGQESIIPVPVYLCSNCGLPYGQEPEEGNVTGEVPIR